MKKSVAITAGVVIVGAGAYLGTTWYTGKQIEAKTQEYLARANEQLAAAVPGLRIRVEQDRYDRGFFTSQAHYSVVVSRGGETQATDQPDETFKLPIASEIQHGPFPAGALKRGKFAPQLSFVHSELESTEQLKPVFDMAQGKPLLWSDTVISYSGGADGEAGIAPISFKQEDKGAFNFSGATIRSTYDHRTQSVKGRLESKEVSIDTTGTDDPVKGRLADLSVDVDTKMGKFGVSVGTTSMLIKTVEVTPPAEKGPKVLLENLGYEVKLAEDDTFLSGAAAYKVAKVNVAGEDFGGAELALSASHLDGKTVQAISEAYRQMIRGVMSGGEGDEGLKDEQIGSLIENGQKLLEGQPSIGIDQLVWRNAAGESRFSVKIDLTKPPVDSEFSGNSLYAAGAKLVLNSIKSLNADLKVSKPMAQTVTEQVLRMQGVPAEEAKKQAAEQIQNLAGLAEMMNAGKNDGDNIVSKFTFANGRGELNGKEVPVADLLANLADSGDDGHPMDDEGEPVTVTNFDEDVIDNMVGAAGLEYSADAAGHDFFIESDELTPTEFKMSIVCAPECDKLRVTATYGDKKATTASLKTWNADYGDFAHAAVNKQGRPTLQMELDASEGGITMDVVQDSFNAFLQLTDEFDETLTQ